ncbi:antitoxin [Pseudonocardia sp. GCM10023141]|uniref:antitoxin n=1 Tax=Pseudonocardia sp. GCM10023141 TaxID=3252653 RepID=UPI00360CAF6A
MSFLDKAKELLNQHDDKVDQGLDKAGEMAKGRFAGHEDQIDGLTGKAKGMTGGGDTTQTPPPPAPEGEQPPPPPQ